MDADDLSNLLIEIFLAIKEINSSVNQVQFRIEELHILKNKW